MQTISTPATKPVARPARSLGRRALASLRRHESFTTILTVIGTIALAAGLITDDLRWIVAMLLLWLPALIRLTIESAAMIGRDLQSNH